MNSAKLNGIFFDVSNSSTGEFVAQHQSVTLTDNAPKKRHPFRKFWFANMSYPLEKIMTITRARDFHLLFSLLGMMDNQNLITATTPEISRALGMLPNHVQSAMKRLEATGIIYKDGRAYRVNEGFAWRGSLDTYPWKDVAGSERAKYKSNASTKLTPEKQS